jgi:alkylhydroperoxidase/carboxymuconolactone decarboxylase family protein YurZ
VLVRDTGETLRRIALRDESVAESMQAGMPSELDYRAFGIAQIAALVATGGSPASYGRATGIAQLGGATDDELVAVLLAVAPILGIERSVAEAPKLGLALGYDVDAAVHEPPNRQRAGGGRSPEGPKVPD